jgi:Uma2 family endonuclease
VELPAVTISFRTFAQLALEDAEGRWELMAGGPRRKPPGSFLHGALIDALTEQIVPQLSGTAFRLSVNHARIMIDPHHVCTPDLAVVPRALSTRALRERPNALETYHTSLPLIIDVWTPPTAGFDVDARIPEYRRANTEEIWIVHPAARAITTWVRRTNGVYEEVIRAGGVLNAARIPDLALNIEMLFA